MLLQNGTHTIQCNRSNKLQSIAKFCLPNAFRFPSKLLSCFSITLRYDEAASGSNRAALFGWRRLHYSCSYCCYYSYCFCSFPSFDWN